MNRICYLVFFFILFSTPLLAQTEEGNRLESIPDSVPSIIDSLYREDQFYVGLTFNLIGNKPESISQSGFSGGIHVGFTRDFPINKRRNIAIAAGLGWSLNSYSHNLFIGEDESGETIFRNLTRDIDYSTNRFTAQLIEAPLEFRWRTSTPETYKFWRIYTGLKLGYIYHFKSNFIQPENQVVQTDVPELDRFRMGATFTFGYNTFNFHIYYSLNSLFPDARLNEETIDISVFRVGLMFYIL
ncbi:porin family protein [Salegentibacter salegens]|uniref:Outer membrane protein beta-barrel domain-containing protein n=1 Tax=Salegentibacter salegens TaxID=143223 RepID=A0A1M7LUR5_9FLAO|nr:porin family protein [Salegentibacter salegens]PRX52165.1 outer membrane protein with beta-barrel domain [Salegentibacter salegens]SHM82018.1 Outer membrane protein beta-barrel domain-containing protein [Salegentibacter salegens]